MNSSILAVALVSLLSAFVGWCCSRLREGILALFLSILGPAFVCILWAEWLASGSSSLANEYVAWAPFVVGQLAMFAVPSSLLTLLVFRSRKARCES